MPAKRKALATELLSAQASSLETTTRKFRERFDADLHAAANAAQDQPDLTPKLRLFIEGLATFWRADARDSERNNKTISMLRERGPNIGDDLLSSRVVLKHHMGETNAGAGLQGRKFSDFRPVAEGLKQLRLACSGRCYVCAQ